MRSTHILILVWVVFLSARMTNLIHAQEGPTPASAVDAEAKAPDQSDALASSAAGETPDETTEPIVEVGAMATPMSQDVHAPNPGGISRASALVGSLTVFALAVFVGFEVIAKVPPTLHTPLMSGSNAISGITVVGAIISAGNGSGGFACFLALIATALATINVVGGFMVTHRMLLMFKKR